MCIKEKPEPVGCCPSAQDSAKLLNDMSNFIVQWEKNHYTRACSGHLSRSYFGVLTSLGRKLSSSNNNIIIRSCNCGFNNQILNVVMIFCYTGRMGQTESIPPSHSAALITAHYHSRLTSCSTSSLHQTPHFNTSIFSTSCDITSAWLPGPERLQHIWLVVITPVLVTSS